MDTETQVAFEGSKEQQELAARSFELMKRKGMLFAASAPIKMTVDGIAKALAKEGGAFAGASLEELKPKIEGALRANPGVFAPGGAGGEFVTTKSGHAYSSESGGNAHTFRQRLNADATELDADAAREYASSLMSRAATRAERSAIMETIVEMPSPPPSRPSYAPPPTFPRSTEIPTLIPRSAVAEEVAPEIEIPASAQQVEAPLAPPPAKRVEEQPTAPPARRVEARPTPPEPEVRPAQPAPAAPQEAEVRSAPPVPPPAPVQEPAIAAPEVPQAAPPVAPKAPPQAPPPPAVTGPVEVVVATGEGPVTVDLRASVSDIMANAAVASAIEGMLRSAVEMDTRLVAFGTEVFPDEAVERFSKGDFRRIKEYLDEPETGGVASDRDIMADVLGRRLEQPDYERLRFSLDYRMLKEKKDFEFVGIDSDRLWINAGSSAVPAPGRKPAEIGQDYRFLEDPAIASVEEEYEPEASPRGAIVYDLTNYEYENGVLPYDVRFKRVFPGAVFEDQRSSLLRFEIPQLYGAILAELRYPTGNRGGFIMGLNELFAEHMVPGARFTVTPTDRGEDVFELQFGQIEEREENLLQFDERKGRYVFRPVVFSIDTAPAMLLAQEKFGKLQNQKKLDDAERRRPDAIIANAFEAVGDSVDGKYWAIFDDLFPVVNLERPISRSWLQTLLSGAYPFFYPDETTEGAYFYEPEKRPG